jgi:hypothetical protein
MTLERKAVFIFIWEINLEMKKIMSNYFYALWYNQKAIQAWGRKCTLFSETKRYASLKVLEFYDFMIYGTWHIQHRT